MVGATLKRSSCALVNADRANARRVPSFNVAVLSALERL